MKKIVVEKKKKNLKFEESPIMADCFKFRVEKNVT
jgi:hypothetical protein